MPIHLPPLSRRLFLRRAIIASLGLTLPAPRLQAASRVDPHAWAFFADTHIDADPTRVARRVNMAENFRAAARDLFSLRERPAAVLINGDLALQSGETADYKTFAALLGDLHPFPIHLTLGNHDHRARFLDSLRAARAISKPVSDRHVALVKSARANFFLLDSLDQTTATPGRIGEDQLRWLARTLDAHAHKPAIIVAHHNLEGETFGLKDATALLEVLDKRRQVKAYIHGHTHRWSLTRLENGLHCVGLPPVAYVFDDTSPNGWVLARVEHDRLGLELRCLRADHPQNGQRHSLPWRT